jgi:hypothetical protein
MKEPSLDLTTMPTTDALESIAAELERLRVLKKHELGVRLEEDSDGSGPYAPKAGDE